MSTRHSLTLVCCRINCLVVVCLQEIHDYLSVVGSTVWWPCVYKTFTDYLCVAGSTVWLLCVYKTFMTTCVL